ncbi:MAG: MarR family transcriptional regulator [Actinomycetota bacterium]|nr:MarR family transcriptional regulator [Actinomycetota bacterium]
MSDGTLGSRFASADDSPGLALWHVTNRWQAVMRSALAPHDLTHVQYVLLATLVWHLAHEQDAVLTQVDLAALAATDVMMTSQVLRALEGKGLIERARHPDDGRARVLRPTAAGIVAAQRATGDVERADAEYFDALADPTRFRSELARLIADRASR